MTGIITGRWNIRAVRLEDLTYVDQIQQYYQYFYDRNIAVHMIPCDADFGRYKM